MAGGGGVRNMLRWPWVTLAETRRGGGGGILAILVVVTYHGGRGGGGGLSLRGGGYVIWKGGEREILAVVTQSDLSRSHVSWQGGGGRGGACGYS